MVRKHDDRSQGFTLIELMIVVAIIGVLASVAIPSFVNYQLTSKRAEAFANLSAIGKAQKSYFAEFNGFVAVASQPSIGLGGVDPAATKRSSAPINAAFQDLGWVPDGDVFFDYDSNTAATPQLGTCTCTDACFTASAYGNLDGDATMSVLVYTHPDAAGGFCGSGLLNKSPPPNAGSRLFDQVARVIDADDF